jgi:hypothetical protein
MITNCRCFFRWNTFTKEDDGALPHPRLLLLLSFSLLQQHHRKRRWCIAVVFFFSNTKKKVMVASYRGLLRFNTIKEESNGNKLFSLSLLEHHHRRR